MNSRRVAALAAAFWLAGASLVTAAPAAPEPTVVEKKGFITEYILESSWQPWDIDASGPEGVWMTLDGPKQIGRLNPATGEVTRYESPEPVQPFLLSRGPDGAIWFSDFEYVAQPPPGRIWRIDPETGAFTMFDMPDPKGGPAMIAFDAEGLPWVTEMVSGKVGRLKDGRLEELELAPGGRPERALPVGIVFDQDGRLWVAESGSNRIVAYDPDGKSTVYQVPEGFWSPTDIKFGPDGLLWTGGHGTSEVASLDPRTGEFAVYPLRKPDDPTVPVSRPQGIDIDAKGQIWAAEHEGDRIARVIPSENLVVEYPLEKLGYQHPWPQWLSVDPAGNVWYASWGTSRIGKIDADPPYWKVEAELTATKVSAGGRVTGTAVASPRDGAEGAITWEAAGANYGIFAKASANPDGSASFAIDVDADMPPGIYQALVGVRTEALISSQVVTFEVVRPLLGIPGLTFTHVGIGGGAMVAAALAWLVLQGRRKA